MVGGRFTVESGGGVGGGLWETGRTLEKAWVRSPKGGIGSEGLKSSHMNRTHHKTGGGGQRNVL